MRSIIAYPMEILDTSKLEEYYADLEDFNPKEHFTNSMRANLLRMKFLGRELRKERNGSDPSINWQKFSQSPNSVTDNNAYNLAPSGYNGIMMPAAYLQGFRFSSDRPVVMNYALSGFVVGHELTHGFDPNGRLFNWEGELEDWWQPETDFKYYKYRFICQGQLTWCHVTH